MNHVHKASICDSISLKHNRIGQYLFWVPSVKLLIMAVCMQKGGMLLFWTAAVAIDHMFITLEITSDFCTLVAIPCTELPVLQQRDWNENHICVADFAAYHDVKYLVTFMVFL